MGNFNLISGNGLGGKSLTTGLGLLSILLLGKTNFGTGVSSQKAFLVTTHFEPLSLLYLLQYQLLIFTW